MRLAGLIAAIAFAASACASSPRAVDPNNSPPPAPAPDTTETPPAAGASQAIASPRDSVQVNVAGATVAVNYGRPFMRGRTIFGGLVPYNQVWRTGANEATAFRTTSDLTVNGVRVPAGNYTLYSLPREGTGGQVGEWLLIINRQTGQWGTEYDQSQDLARIPMRVTRLDRPVEQFTVRVTPESAGSQAGRIIMMWERTQGTLDFRVAG